MGLGFHIFKFVSSGSIYSCFWGDWVRWGRVFIFLVFLYLLDKKLRIQLLIWLVITKCCILQVRSEWGHLVEGHDYHVNLLPFLPAVGDLVQKANELTHTGSQERFFPKLCCSLQKMPFFSTNIMIVLTMMFSRSFPGMLVRDIGL